MSIVDDDLIQRSVSIDWPDGYEPGHADLFAHNAIIIDAPAGTIWARLTDAAAWPAWYSNASDVVVNHPSGTLGEGVTFDWTRSASRSPARSPGTSRTPGLAGTAPAISSADAPGPGRDSDPGIDPAGGHGSSGR